MTLTTPIALADGVHLATLGADIVVLDIRQDRYACLVDGASYLTPHPDQTTVSVRDDVIEQMIATGWVVPGATPSARKLPPRPMRCLCGPPSRGPAACLGVMANALAGQQPFRTASLHALLRMADQYRRQALASPSRRTGAAALVGNFYSVLPWLPGQGLCLHRSYMLLRYLARRGIACDWVFGVRTWPFAAHCWLVMDDAVLGDELDRVRAFTPILMV